MFRSVFPDLNMTIEDEMTRAIIMLPVSTAKSPKIGRSLIK